jgi:hypothetical protein
MGLTPVEVSLSVRGTRGDEWFDVRVRVAAEPSGESWGIPCFRSGAGDFRFRFSAPHPGRYTWKTEGATGLFQNLSGTVDIPDQPTAVDLFRHGRLRVAGDGRTIEHIDGTPFLWVADTWWMAFTSRLPWPGEFARLTEDRARKGFTVIQVVAGPLPDYDAPDQAYAPGQANETGCSWEPGWKDVNAAYYDRVDQGLQHLIRNGLVPCIVGMWGYWGLVMGEERVRRHWRNLIARYAAWPVVWCVAGETGMPTYHTIFREDAAVSDAETARQIELWSRMAVYVHDLDPWHNPITLHPRAPGASRRDMTPGAPLDLEMVQTTHMGYSGLQGHLETLSTALHDSPRLPVFVAEANYEGIMGSSWADIQRFLFWTAMTMGCCGHTYGAQGVWGMNSKQNPHRGFTGDWGRGFWEDAMHYPGSAQVGMGARILARYPWRQCQPFDEPAAVAQGRPWSFAMGIPGKLAIYYLPANTHDPRHLGCVSGGWRGDCLPLKTGTGTAFRASFIDPITGNPVAVGTVTPDAAGNWTPPRKPSSEDWVLVLERT